MSGRLLKVPEVAELLQVTERLVWKMIAKRRIDSIKVEGSRRIPVSAVEAYLARHTEKAR